MKELPFLKNCFFSFLLFYVFVSSFQNNNKMKNIKVFGSANSFPSDDSSNSLPLTNDRIR